VMKKDCERQIAPLKLTCEKLTSALSGPAPIPKRTVSVRRHLHGLTAARPRTLGLSGIQVRQHIRVTK
jgi:hypothetical protein